MNWTQGISAVQRAAKRQVDAAAGRARARYITVVPGQSETYTAKALEAERYIADGASADLTNYPLIAAEMAAFGYATGAQAANAILAMRAQWLQVGAQIERIRLKAKRDIDAATDVATIASVRAQAVSDLEAI